MSRRMRTKAAYSRARLCAAPASLPHSLSRPVRRFSARRQRSEAVMEPNNVLTIIWAGIVAFAVFSYIVLDGFDLGIGMLFPLLVDAGDRGRAMNSIAPVWDGNETWLVLGG